MNKNELNIYLNTDNKSGYKTREIHIKNNFPEMYKIIINYYGSNWMEKLYNFVNSIDNNPTCIRCGKTLHLKKYYIGYHDYCSIICRNKSEIIINKIKQTCLNKYGVNNPSKLEEVKKKIKNKICKNGVWYNETDECKKKEMDDTIGIGNKLKLMLKRWWK